MILITRLSCRDNGRLLRQKYLFIIATAVSMLVMAGIANDILPNDRTFELARTRFGPQAAERLKAWRNLTLSLSGTSESNKLTQVNRFFNSLPNEDDMVLWGVPDYWATPVELLVRNAGSCHDFALAKYFTLKAVGIPEEKLRITYARVWLPQRARLETHMVLAYYPNPEADPLILDNLMDTILPASQRTDLVPIINFNAGGLWSAKQRGQSGRIGDITSIHHWNELLARMSEEHSGVPR